MNLQSDDGSMRSEGSDNDMPKKKGAKDKSNK